MQDLELTTGGYTFKAAHLLFAAPVVSALATGIYFSYDVVNRFYAVEEAFFEVTDTNSRVQALEQTVLDNDVRGLNSKLTQLSTQMTTLLERQQTLLELRSKVERAELITDGIDDKLEALQDDINSTWDAIDELGKPL
jgi:chromosome segregation ATPase|tara:strand:- start:528 stop:941 length:414 start_codon:yes stop_codon:yes gene_type:complete